ncbi:signal recognition particle-docking protein FtsY [Apilactobacillus quenuiae]|uniref:signal recognition particle-docking protein FtsY n=1 Tax=Apilactobacillus quenuiae TaxID=2008377 RepID=UPI000D02181B|nr:signal recognition particle-docking protein FtsY [Apilactobacillus quenuiae]
MGLFDIFKRRSKKDKEKREQQEQNEEQTNELQTSSSENDSQESNNDNESKYDVRTNEYQSKHNEEKDSDINNDLDNIDKASSEGVDNLASKNHSEEQEQEQEQESDKFEEGLSKSRSTFGEKLNRLFANFRSVDEDFFDDLEDTLIESDVGFDMAVNLTDQLRDEVKLQNAKNRSDVQNVIIQKMIDIYDQAGNNESTEINMAENGPTVILFVGVNGVGKTTTIGKMADKYKKDGKKVLLAAADTFRAGAIEQLDEWAKRDQVDIVKKPEKSDPSAVVYEAVHKAKEEDYDVLFVDTAGRLQNKVNLMNELSKMKKVLTREIPEAPHEVLLVLDATTGQNALNQAKLFKETTDVTGIILTKLDGTAKGGIVLAIRNELHLPVKYVGLGEKVSDLSKFDANDYVYGLFKGLIK